jgi:methionyl-tRNA formyltransferase
MKNNCYNFAFFGSSIFSLYILEELKRFDFLPSLIVTRSDKPAGRGQKLTPTPVKIWALNNSIPVFQPNDFYESNIKRLKNLSSKNSNDWDFFIVASYGFILPTEVIYMPIRNSLNVHPSLLPKLRGTSPIESAILKEEETGVTIIRMDEKMDHGPVLAQKKVNYKDWPPDAPTLEKDLAKEGALLLVETAPRLIKGEIKETPQDEEKATYTAMIRKNDAFLDFKNEKPELLYRKIKAYKDRFKPYFFINTSKKQNLRLIVTDADLVNGKLIIKKVLPEGNKETDYKEFIQRNRLSR